jgi:hypothetical protein
MLGTRLRERYLDYGGVAEVGLETSPKQLLLSLGAAGHGIPFHWHTAAWFELLTGTKHWRAA